MIKTDPLLGRLCTALVATIPMALDATAQGARREPNAAVDSPVEEIIVTAQKREQSLQDVPVVVTALSGQLLQDSGVQDIKDLTIVAPGLVVTSTTSEASTTARIRGIGTVADNPGLESSVGVVIDGIYRPRNGVGFGDLGELHRIEILKGPQGTLFGKNTSAGVINILTAPPQFEFGADGELTAGNYGTREAAGSITGPIFGQTIAGRLYAASRKRDGFNDVSTGSGPRTAGEDYDRNFYTVRGQLLFLPSDALRIRIIADYSDRDEICCAAMQTVAGASSAIIDALAPDSGTGNPSDRSARRAFLNRPTPQKITDEGLSAQMDWDLPALAASLTAVSGWRNWQYVGGLDADFTSADILFRAPDGRYGNEFEQFSQELRMAGEAGVVSWLVGAFYAHEQLDSRFHLAYGAQFEPYYSLLFSQGQSPSLVSLITGLAPASGYPVAAGQLDQFEQTSDSYALFTHNSILLSDRIEATLGVRFTSEEKELDARYANFGGGSAGCAASRARRDAVNAAFAAAPAGTAAAWYNFGCGTFADPAFDDFASRQDISESEWSGTAKLVYRFHDQVMSYVSYARGHKAGGFNLERERILDPVLGTADPQARGDTDTSFAPERADSYELGVKSGWLRDRLLLNATAFYQEFTNFQLNTFTGVAFIVASVPKATSKGVDLDLFWSTGGALSIQGGVTYADTRYAEFAPLPGISPNLPGSQVGFAPKWSGSLSATITRPLGGSFLGRANVSAKSTSSYNTGSDVVAAKDQNGFTLVNARLGLGSGNGRWMLEVWAENVTDRDHSQVIIDTPLQPGSYHAFLGTPRTYGITLRLGF